MKSTRHQVTNLPESQVRDQVGDVVAHPAWDQMRGPIVFRVWDLVRRQVWDLVSARKTGME